MISCFFFFFKQKTAYEMRISDWSSDVCSSDLLDPAGPKALRVCDEHNIPVRRLAPAQRTHCRLPQRQFCSKSSSKSPLGSRGLWQSVQNFAIPIQKIPELIHKFHDT